MRLLVVTTTGVTVNSFLLPHIRQLQLEGHEVEIACEGSHGLVLQGLPTRPPTHEIPFDRNPLARNNARAYGVMRRILARGSYDIVHTHTPVASTVTRLAARKALGVRVFYTAHGFHFYRGAPLVNWLTYYPIEKALSRATDTLITINQEDYQRARQKFKARRVFLVPGVGIEPEPDAQRESRLPTADRESDDTFVLLSIGELNMNKGHELVIRALALIGDRRIKYLIAGSGAAREQLQDVARQLGVSGQVQLLGHRSDVEQLLRTVDAYVHPSYREGLPVAILEAMRAGLPIVASDIRGCRDELANGAGLLVPPGDSAAFAGAIRRLKESPSLRRELGAAAQTAVEQFHTDHVLAALQHIYADS